MRNRPRPLSARLACASTILALLAFGVIGCDGSSGSKTGTSTELPPEAKQANKSMEDFMKGNQKK